MRRLEVWTVDELLAAHPGAVEVLVRHGVDPRSRCHVAARRHMTLGRVLGRVCPVDVRAATLAELEAFVGEGS
jgi:hypothetical protein